MEAVYERARHDARCGRANFLLDDRGAVVAEYAIVMTFFTIVSLVAIQVIGQIANNSVDLDETNFSNSMVIGN